MEILQEAMARGLVGTEEGDERMAAAFAARFRDELPPLTADLPPAETAAPAPARPVGWRRLLTALLTLICAEIAPPRPASGPAGSS